MTGISWTPLDLPAFDTVRGCLWVYCPPTPISSTATTAAVVGRFLTERFDRKDHPHSFNYNYYLLAESTAGRIFQSGPLLSTDPPHHSTGPAPSLDAYGPPPA